MKVGLFFGSFNPIHTGHLIIANYVRELTGLDQVWFVVSPQNPFKQKEHLLSEYDRLHLVNLAIEGNEKLRASDIEFRLPRPSYTIDTLTYLKEKYPTHQFHLLMGGDNLHSFHKWKNHEKILEHHSVIVYNRKGYHETNFSNHPNVKMLDVPLLEISATFIRDNIRNGKSVRYFLPDKVHDYITEMNYFKN